MSRAGASGTRTDVDEIQALKERLSAMREFLVPLWIAWGIERNRPLDTRGQGMCRFTAAFLAKTLGPGWKFDGGTRDYFDWHKNAWCERSDGGGFRDRQGQWHSHHWARRGRLIAELTGAQFGEDDVIVTSTDDDRYRSTMLSRRMVAEALRDVNERAETWARLWHARQQALEPSEVVYPIRAARLR